MSANLAALVPGDHVRAGAGMRAELRSTFAENADTAVVRWLHWSDSIGWWGAHHSRVPWSTIQPVKGS